MANQWPEAATTLYTKAQLQRQDEANERKYQTRLRSIAARSQEDVDRTVEKLKYLLSLPQVRDLRVQLAWIIHTAGVDRLVLDSEGHYEGKEWNPLPRVASTGYRIRKPYEPGELTAFKLTRDGLLCFQTRLEPRAENDPATWRSTWDPIDPEEYPDLVRWFSISTSQIAFLISQLLA